MNPAIGLLARFSPPRPYLMPVELLLPPARKQQPDLLGPVMLVCTADLWELHALVSPHSLARDVYECAVAAIRRFGGTKYACTSYEEIILQEKKQTDLPV